MRLRSLCIFLVLAVPALASDWFEIKSPNFVVRTDSGDRRGREIALRFEQMRKVFAIFLPRPLKPAAPLMVIAFRNRAELERVGPMWKGKPVDLAGFYSKGEDRNYIVLDSQAENAWQAVFHEYSHFLMNTNFPPTPLWWDEGFADYFSTVEVNKKDFLVGDAPAGYPELLEQGLMPLDRLFSVTAQASEYNQKGHDRNLFYAQSWLFVHYLFRHKLLDQTMQYASLLQNFHETPAIAVQKAYGRTFKELDGDLKKYFDSDRARLYRFPLPLDMASVSYETRKLPDITVDATIADLHLHSPDHQQEAEQEFRQIVQKLPESSDGHRGLGYVLLRRGDFDAAAREFEQAAELGSDDPKVYYFAAYSMFKRSGDDNGQLATMSQYVDRALLLDPAYAEAYNLKAIFLGRASNHAEAVRLLKKAVALEPRHEEYKLNLAYHYMAQRQFDEAIAVLEPLASNSDASVAASAKQQLATAREWKAHPLSQMAAEYNEKQAASPWARKPGDQPDPEAEQLQSAQSGDREQKVDNRPMKFAKGTLLSSVCSEEGSALIKAKVGNKTLTLHAPDYAKVVLIGAKPFDCAWKNRPVAINYRETSALEGDLFSLEVH